MDRFDPDDGLDNCNGFCPSTEASAGASIRVPIWAEEANVFMKLTGSLQADLKSQYQDSNLYLWDFNYSSEMLLLLLLLLLPWIPPRIWGCYYRVTHGGCLRFENTSAVTSKWDLSQGEIVSNLSTQDNLIWSFKVPSSIQSFRSLLIIQINTASHKFELGINKDLPVKCAD